VPSKTKPSRKLPTAQEIKSYIKNASGTIGRREIARAFNITGNERIQFKKLLRELKSEGEIVLSHRRKVNPSRKIPPVTVIKIIKISDDGDALAKLEDSAHGMERIKILIPHSNKHAPFKLGDRVLAKLNRTQNDFYEATIIRRLETTSNKVIGVLKEIKGEMNLLPIDGKRSNRAIIEKDESTPIQEGDIVSVEIKPQRRLALKRAKVVEVLGNQNTANAVSLICIHEHDIPFEFPDAAIRQASSAEPVLLDDKRTDLRDINLITVDGADARDFDDAIWAEPDETGTNLNGWRLIVAIADVANYVKPNDPLDVEAKTRGNSVYFPDRVVPMLPEALSNGLCSLKPNEDRACLAVEIVIDSQGKKKSHHFIRGLMRSKARITYDQLQSEFNSLQETGTETQISNLASPLYGAFNSLLCARTDRGALEIEMPEMQIKLAENGQVEHITPRDRLDSHRLIEEFMILANVCAAETLENKKYACVYRVHDSPNSDKVEALRLNLEGFDIKLSKGQVITAKLFNQILQQAKGQDCQEMISQLVLRSQSQAVYSANNLGHFGLGLRRYAHFTSPIRRYSDLLVHRALISSHDFENDVSITSSLEELESICEQISKTERRAVIAERAANDRYAALFMCNRIGETFDSFITGVTRFGVFVSFGEARVDALLPISSLPDDYYEHDEKRHTLSGRHNGISLNIGKKIPVILRTADPITGRLAVDYSGSLVDQEGNSVKKLKHYKKRKQNYNVLKTSISKS
jgi:ribonuclease R